MENSKLQNFLTQANSRVEVLKRNFVIKPSKEIFNATESKSTQTVLKSKIKEIILLFDAKISQMVPVNNGLAKQSTSVENPCFQSKEPSCVTAMCAQNKPTVKTGNKISCDGCQVRKPNSQPPLIKATKSVNTRNRNVRLHHILNEEDFDQLSVKDKVLVYTKFIDICEKDASLKRHLSENKKCTEGNVLCATQTPVKYLVKNLEAGCCLIKPKTGVDNQTGMARTSGKDEVRLFSVAKFVKEKESSRCGKNVKTPTRNKDLPKPSVNDLKSPKATTDSAKQSNGDSFDGSPKAYYVPIKRIRRIRPKKLSKNTENEKLESTFSTLDKPPENELQKSHDHNPAALSEHQLRIQASLQRLNIPDWFRQYNQNQSRSPESAANTSSYRPGNFTRKRAQDSGRWAGLNSKTTSLSSLGSQRSDRSPLLLSPSAHSHHGGQTSLHTHNIQNANVSAGSGGAGTFSRWSTSHLNSSQISPSVSQRGSFSRGGPINSSFMSVSSGHSAIRNSMRQPYMGWRSQEKLSQRTAHERLASSLLAQQQRTSPSTRTTILTNVNNGSGNNKLPPLVTPEIQTSIKEVTSAIVHYVNDQTNQQRSRSTSPNSRKCWLESSFVGTRPLDSPQTPIIENTTFTTAVAAAAAASLLTTTNIATATATNNNNNNFHTANHNQYNLNTRQDLPVNLLGNEAVLTRMNNGGALNNGTTTYSSVSSASGTNLIHNIGTGYTSLPAAPERSLSSASLEDVLTSLLGLSTTTTYTTTASVTSGVTLATDATATYARSSTGDAIASEATLAANNLKHMPQNIQQKTQPIHSEYEQQKENIQQQNQLQVLSKEEQQRLRRRSEGDAPTQKSKQLQHQNQKLQQYAANANVKTAYASDSLTTLTHSSASSQPATNNINVVAGTGTGSSVCLAPRRVSLGDSSESNNKTISAASGELQIKCRNTKCDRSATPADAKKYYKSCHNCTYLYCSRECRRAHWEKHRKACLHSRASNLCRQVLATCKDDLDSQRHLSLMARKGYLSQGRGVVRILFRSAEAAEGFIKHGFQCLGEASYVRWPDLMPAEMGLELYSELLRFSTEYKPESKMLIYVAICVVSEAPGMGQAPVRWERQLVSRCAKLKLCKSVLAELDQPAHPTSGILQQQQQQLSQPITMITVPEPTTEVLILTFNPQLRTSSTQRELVFSNILNILSRRGVVLRRHYPEIFQRLQSFAEGQTEKFNPVTLHPRNSQTGQNFVCIIMPVHSESEIIKLPSAADGGNRVTTIDVGSQAALAQLDDDELLMRTTS